MTQGSDLISVVLNSLTEENLSESRTVLTTGLDGLFYAAFGIDHASTGDAAGFQRLRHLADEITQAPAVVSRLRELKSKGLSVHFTVYDEPAGHFLCVLVKDHAFYDESLKKFELAVARRRGFVLSVRSSSEALDFYRDKLGFNVQSTYRLNHGADDPAYHVMTKDGATIHVSSFPADGAIDGVVTVIVADIEKLQDEFTAKGIDVVLGEKEQPWEDRVLYVRDAAGNTVRFQSA